MRNGAEQICLNTSGVAVIMLVIGVALGSVAFPLTKTMTTTTETVEQTSVKTVVEVMTTQPATSGNITAENQLLQQEISFLEKDGNLGLDVLAVNKTVTVPPQDSLLYANIIGYNGTLEFESTNGCNMNVMKVGNEFVNGTHLFVFPLDASAMRLAGGTYSDLSGNFSVLFQNVGTSPVNCTFSLFYVFTGFPTTNDGLAP